MPQFIFAYHGGNTPETAEAGDAAMAAWRAWMDDLGAALVVPGNPVGKSHTVASTGTTEDGGANPISGYSVVEAADQAAACAMARGCPLVADGTGSVEVAPLIEM
jgi:hypothetical protein